MSRSYKKFPAIKERNPRTPGRKSGKQMANKTVRRTKDIANGGGFKKAFCSYIISDYRFVKFENELRREWNDGNSFLHRNFKTYKQALIWWKKSYVNK